MIPTRVQIQEKIDEAKSLGEEVRNYIDEWLDSIECPSNDKVKILSDLGSYEL